MWEFVKQLVAIALLVALTITLITPEKAHEFYDNFMESLENSKKSTRFYFVSSIERNAFTTRDCRHFAKYLNKNLNLPVYYVGDGESKNSSPQDRRWAHFVNRLPGGRFIDVEGVWTEKDLIDRWQVDELGTGWFPNSLNEMDVRELRRMGCFNSILSRY